MNPRGETKTSQLGPAAATLLLAYLLVLQSLVVGVATSARGAALFSDTICLSKASGPLDGGSAPPGRPARHGDSCCVFHCAAFGSAAAPSPFVGEAPPSLSYVEIKPVYDRSVLLSEAATPPLGSRAPPALV